MRNRTRIFALAPALACASSITCESSGSCTELRGHNVTLLDETIDLHRVHDFITDEEAQQLIQFCDGRPGRWSKSMTRTADEAASAQQTVWVVFWRAPPGVPALRAEGR